MDIDFVVTWLDPNDPEWQKQYAIYSPSTKGHAENARFRDMGLFRYWFRAVETYAPWVNKVFLITNGKFPDWINKDNPKLVLVKHEDYIPKEFLPTFNSCTIELHMHRIKGLSEHFVYFNDDIFLNTPIKKEYYFKKGLPCDINKETIYNVPIYTPKDKFGIHLSMLADIGIINGHFRRWNTVRESPKRWFGPHLGIRGLIVSLVLMRQRLFVGFSNLHTEQAYLKSVFAEVWEKEPNFMNDSCTRFREEVIANPYIFRYWQFAKNLFYPMNRKRVFLFLTEKSVAKNLKKVLNNKGIVSICLNDSEECSNEEYRTIYEDLQQVLIDKYPRKSSFEI